jgi:hypothetical protein
MSECVLHHFGTKQNGQSVNLALTRVSHLNSSLSLVKREESPFLNILFQLPRYFHKTGEGKKGLNNDNISSTTRAGENIATRRCFSELNVNS